MATWTNPVNVVGGQPIQSAAHNAQVLDNLRFLGSAKYATVGRLSDQTVATSTWTDISWQFAAAETSEMWAASPNPTRITPTVAGLYLVVYRAIFAADAGATGIRAARVRLNGSTVVGSTKAAAIDQGHPVNIVTVCYCNGSTDYLTFGAWQNTGGDLDLTMIGDEVSAASVIWLGF